MPLYKKAKYGWMHDPRVTTEYLTELRTMSIDPFEKGAITRVLKSRSNPVKLSSEKQKRAQAWNFALFTAKGASSSLSAASWRIRDENNPEAYRLISYIEAAMDNIQEVIAIIESHNEDLKFIARNDKPSPPTLLNRKYK